MKLLRSDTQAGVWWSPSHWLGLRKWDVRAPLLRQHQLPPQRQHRSVSRQQRVSKWGPAHPHLHGHLPSCQSPGVSSTLVPGREGRSSRGAGAPRPGEQRGCRLSCRSLHSGRPTHRPGRAGASARCHRRCPSDCPSTCVCAGRTPTSVPKYLPTPPVGVPVSCLASPRGVLGVLGGLCTRVP